jgi:hypothetical protein
MFNFVDCEAHPHLKAMTELFRRLERQTTAATDASAAEKRYAKEVNDLSPDQRRVPQNAFYAATISSVEEDFTDPGWSGRSPKYTERNTTYASALLNARVRYTELYDTVRETWIFIANEKNMFFAMRDTDKVVRLLMEVFDHNFVCICEQFKKGLEALAGFSDMVGINWHDECPILRFDGGAEVGAFHSQWMNWFGSVPALPAARTVDDRREAHLLVQCLVARDQADRLGGFTRIPTVTAYDHVSTSSKNSVVQRLIASGWKALLDTLDLPAKISVSRPRNKHAPFIRPIEAPRRRFLQRV